jgi:hypothetical protein
MVDVLTLLGSPATIGSKTWTPAGPIDYSAPMGPFVVKRIPVADLNAAAAVLLACPANAFVVRGRTDADTIPYRRIHARAGEPATMAPEAHHLLPIDIDSGGGSEPRTDIEAMAMEARSLLPDAFHNARCLAVATSSAGVKPGARLRLWFWCSRPVSDTEAKGWLEGLADTSIYMPVQPVYCAPPRFDGVADPFAGKPRHVWLDGDPEVQAPDQMVRAPRAPAVPGLFGTITGTRNNTLTSIAGTMRKRGLAAPAIAAALREHNATFPEPLPGEEVEAIALSVERYEPEQIAPPAKGSEKAAERAARKAQRKLSEDPALAPVVAVELAKHVRSGALSEGQAVTAMRRGLDAADVVSTVAREDLASMISAAPVTDHTLAPWEMHCVLNEDGQVISCPENLRVVLQHYPGFRLWWNTRAQQDMWSECPWHEPGPVLPTDDFALRAWLSRNLKWHKCPAEPLAAIAEVSRALQWDPWRAGLDRLVWDGTPRVHCVAHEILGAPDEEVYATLFAWWLISAVARTYQPGCQVDHVIVLEGAQMLGKTSFLRQLALGDEFFSRLVSGADLNSPRTIGKIHGPVIIEMAELAVLRRAEVESIKAFIDERTDRVQWLYSRKPVDVPRTCVFAATTNDNEYLRDTTGNRRFWPIPCGTIDLGRLGEVREQLWAEAIALYRAGAKWWPTREEMDTLGIAALQSSRQEIEPLHDAIVGVLERTYAPGRHPLTGTVIAADNLGRDGRPCRVSAGLVCELAGLPPSKESRSVIRILKMLGWTRLTAEGADSKLRLWIAPDDRGEWEDRVNAN